jgi:sugar porter (SP) family MFS transporter
MFGAGVLPSGLFLLLLLLVPESPRWLAKQRREGEALQILSRVGGSVHARAELADIQDALSHETGSITQLFLPGMRVALVIGVLLAILQQVTGVNVFGYYAPEIFKKLGYDTSTALLMTALMGSIDLVFTVIAIWTVDLVGRKPLMITGSIGMGLCLVLMGVAFYAEGDPRWMLVLTFAYKACFAMSVGPVTWVILSEIFPTGIRGRAMAIATVCLWVANFIVIQTFTMMDESHWLIDRLNHAFPFWLYAGFCLVSVLFLWRFVPETKGRTLEEIEREWMRKAHGDT